MALFSSRKIIFFHNKDQKRGAFHEGIVEMALLAVFSERKLSSPASDA